MSYERYYDQYPLSIKTKFAFICLSITVSILVINLLVI